MAETHIKVDFNQIPELVHTLMRRVAKLIRSEANREEDMKVRERLYEVAARFEAGQ